MYVYEYIYEGGKINIGSLSVFLLFEWLIWPFLVDPRLSPDYTWNTSFACILRKMELILVLARWEMNDLAPEENCGVRFSIWRYYW